MFNESKRISTVGLISTNVVSKGDTYVISSSPLPDVKGNYSVIITKNGKFYSEYTKAGKTVRGVNNKIQKITSIYNAENRFERLAAYLKEQKMIEKNHQKRIKIRDAKERRRIVNAMKPKVDRKVRNKARKEVSSIMTSYSQI